MPFETVSNLLKLKKEGTVTLDWSHQIPPESIVIKNFTGKWSEAIEKLWRLFDAGVLLMSSTILVKEFLPPETPVSLEEFEPDDIPLTGLCILCAAPSWQPCRGIPLGFVHFCRRAVTKGGIATHQEGWGC